MQTTLTREGMNTIVCRLAAEQCGVEPAEVTLDTHLFADLNYDSLDAAEFTMAIEDEFDVSIKDEDATEVKTVRQAADLLWPLLGGRP